MGERSSSKPSRKKREGRSRATGELHALRERHSGELAFLVELTEELNSTLELAEVFRKTAERLKPHVDYDAFGILLLDPLGKELTMSFGLGYPEAVVQHWRFGLGQGIVGTVAQTGRPLLVGDVLQEPRYIHGLGGVRSELAVPLIAKKRVIGVLDVQSKRPNHFSERHQTMLSLLAGNLANAIENARLYENLRAQARTLSLLHEAGRELTSILELEALLRRVAELVKRIVDYQLFAVMLWNEETRLLEHTFSLRFDERMSFKDGFPLGYGISGTVAALRQPIRVPNINLDPRYVNCGHGVEVRSELAVPLVFKERLIGVVDLESTEYNAFTEEHEQILSTLASHLAIAVENARLYEKVRENERRLAEDLATAREIQKGLLPASPPEVPGAEIGAGYAPARQLGGDFYDYLSYGDDRLAIAVGDVAGKASAAALQGSLAVGILRGHVVEHPCPPAEMLGELNRHLEQPRLDNRFVALVFAVYDARERRLAVANAGFPRPWLVRDGRVEPIPVEGVPLGLLPGTRYEQRDLALQPGDVVVFCSDGVHECATAQGEEFGPRRMEAMLASLASRSAQEIARGLLEATDEFVDPNGEPADDRTVVVLKVIGS